LFQCVILSLVSFAKILPKEPVAPVTPEIDGLQKKRIELQSFVVSVYNRMLLLYFTSSSKL
jgi:hypothetical protein